MFNIFIIEHHFLDSPFGLETNSPGPGDFVFSLNLGGDSPRALVRVLWGINVEAGGCPLCLVEFREVKGV